MGPLLLSLPLVFLQTTTTPDPAQIALDDAMLAPPPPAQQSLASWQEALAIVRERSTDIQIAHAGIARAEAGSRTALAALLPQLNGSGTGTLIPYSDGSTSSISLNGVTISQGFTPGLVSVNGSLQFSQSLIAPRLIYALGTAHANEQVARLTESDTKRTVTLTVANAMVAVVSAERVADLNRVGLRSALERLDVAKRRQTGGAATGLDVVRAQQDVESARATLVQADESLRVSRENLGLAIGVPGQVGIAPSFDARAVEDGTRSICKAAGGIDERSDVMIAKQGVVVAGRGLTDAKLAFSPTLGLTSAFSLNASENSVHSHSSSATWTVSAVLSVPIWDGGARYGAMRDTRAQIDQAQSRLTATRLGATVQVAQAQRGVDVAQQALVVATRGRDLAAEVDRLTRRGFAEGGLTSLELVTAAAGLRQAEINLAQRETDLLRAKILAALAVANCEF
jgi:outer membrane protein TolC